MNKAYRKKIHDKFGGKCAFCGIELTEGCYIWDIEPVKTIVTVEGDMTVINDFEDNMLPACKHCNSLRIRNYSHKMTIEEFRAEVIKSFYGLKHLQKIGVTAAFT